ncbi:uncharacterized protein LOC108914959 [Anoplophora glabripennis]|uniref:uncharacterized protein LOC108914959 n=1 Tax=Anoplophora glabripennis TaxID=217634 RepID=UPI0008740FB8|nr:uncharacterized protein LOC108914959 [Anoplophora glabripennis]
MKLSGRQPRLLPDVMQAIVDLKEGHGSTQNKILEHIQGVINTKKITPRPRNVTMQIRRALKHGVQNGLLKQRGGKFVLGIHPRDFALYKSFQQMGSLNSCCNKCRRGKKGKKRGRRRRRKRHMGDFSDTDYSAKDCGTPEPMEARGRKKRKRRRRRGRKRTELSLSRDSSGLDQSNKSPKNSKELIRPQRSLRKFEENPLEPYVCEDAEKKTEDNYIN